ncbi:MAG TPA: L,D-transpeptidase [Deltaproteobacteria bacterium]|nr:L,D-transpeptidase [Deltaproteobacteria bacterium]
MLPEVVVDVAAAIICFASACHPVLVGKDTPRGEFQLTHYTTKARIYGGDFLSFKETRDSLYTIHRVVNVPGQERRARLKSPDANRRNSITHGCINVDPAVYDELVKCCYNAKLVVK